ncbi:unnamed protein product, partial [Allacma fusca]
SHGTGATLITRSPVALQAWATAEITFLEKLLNHLKTVKFVQKPASDVIRKYLHDYQDSNGKLQGFSNETDLGKQADAVTSNPIATYRMLRRITYELAGVKMHLEEFNLGMFEHFPPLKKWLTTKDVEDAMMGILRVCHVYDFNLELFSEGIIFGEETGSKLNALHCFEIGQYAKRQQMLALSIQFFEMALQKSSNSSIRKDVVLAELNDSILLHDREFDDPEESIEQYLFTKKIITLKKKYGGFYSKKRQTQRTALANVHGAKRRLKYKHISYWELCTKGSSLTEEEKLELACWYENGDPYFLIGPIKSELLAVNPDVVQTYEVISDKKIARLKEIASESLSQSQTEENTDASGKLVDKNDHYRTSVTSWVNDLKVPELRPLSLLIEKITGLVVTRESATEELQVVSYSFTGHYDIHADALGDTSWPDYVEKGDRLATFMFYLQEPKYGGATAFPQSGIVAQPVKGSAIFWYNVYRDGVEDPMSSHGSCPVVIGKKWVANKWIRYYDQFLIRKCGLDDEDKFYIVPSNVIEE